ncbi:hypothetical protein DM02DRAFT_632165 [Periconia macrospinosa]|uniref:Uncharacterized protein n=1 Tax=Periconia macrospinosa TaxID=97972 RepID=A0A2V1DDK8_9PLEO|nr:hypothetical protein DM02DRAFT_632165 [Periconia macrospinosa]
MINTLLTVYLEQRSMSLQILYHRLCYEELSKQLDTCTGEQKDAVKAEIAKTSVKLAEAIFLFEMSKARKSYEDSVHLLATGEYSSEEKDNINTKKLKAVREMAYMAGIVKDNA